MSDNKPPSGRLYPKPCLGAIPGLRTVDRTTPKNPTMRSVLGPQLTSNDFFTKRLGRIPSNTSRDEGPLSPAADKGKGRDISDNMPEETTFRPRLTGRVLGSSSTNWRRTKPPPHLEEATTTAPAPHPQQPESADFASLVAEMRFQRELDLARLQEDRARREEDCACRLADEENSQKRRGLNEDNKISAIINAAINKLDSEDLLKPDGSNVRRWEDALRLTAFERFHNQHFFTPTKDTIPDPYHEKIARGFIHSSVHADLSYDLVDFNSSAEVYKHLVSKFRIVNRAKQIHTWELLKKISLTDYTSSAEAISAVDRCVRTFCKQGVELTWDTIISIIFQGNLRDHLGPTVDQKVDLFMETHDFELPTSGDILRFWEAARAEHQLSSKTSRLDSSALKISLASGIESSASKIVSGIDSGPVSGSQDKVDVSAMALSKPPSCYICKQIGHISPNCPSNQKNNTNPRPIPQHPGSQITFPPCLITYNFNKIPYIKPIQPESRAATTLRAPGPPQPRANTQKQPQKPVEARQMNPDLFAKEIADAEYVFEGKELSAEPSGQRFNLREMILQRDGQEAIWDSGASDNVTGDRHGYLEICRDERGNHRS